MYVCEKSVRKFKKKIERNIKECVKGMVEALKLYYNLKNDSNK